MKILQIAAASAALTLSSLHAQAGPTRLELLSGHDNLQGQDRNIGRGYDYNDSHSTRHNNRHNNRHPNRHINRNHNSSRLDGPGHRSRHAGHTEYRDHRYNNARRYAATAVRQAREACDLGYYSDHPRWSLDFQRHFNWALRVDAWAIEREARKRAKALRELRRAARYEYGYGR